MPADARVAPPPTGRSSITVQATPRTASSRATAQPMIPAPTTITEFFTGVRGEQELFWKEFS
jgi:hypothetical protein